jgi:hypothetical protein
MMIKLQKITNIPFQLFSVLNELLKRDENFAAQNNHNNPTCSTSGENPGWLHEYFPKSDIDQNEENDADLFSIDNDPEVIFDEESCEISMPKSFEDEAKFSDPISENMAKFIKTCCTQKAGNIWRK